jgi:NAD(P)-dependent dehydrogenase (short-subunit alcohol dehydrogenase family)
VAQRDCNQPDGRIPLHEVRVAGNEKGQAGCIINNSSVLGKVGFMGSAGYVAASHGVIGLTQTAALEYAAFGIRVNAVCPSFTETPMLSRAGLDNDDQLHHAVANMHAMKRMAKPEEVPGAVLWHRPLPYFFRMVSAFVLHSSVAPATIAIV